MNDEYYMELALEEAQAAAAIGEVPVGAVVVYAPYDLATRRPIEEPRLVSRAHNMRETLRDASAHAEFLAMREAMRQLDVWRLSQCHVFVTLEPCIMCAGLMHQARIERCVFGAADPKSGALGSLYSVHADERLNHRFEVRSGVCESECAQVLRSFFQKRRRK